MPVAAVTCGGRPTVSSGSSITIAGSICGWKMIFLVWSATSVMTDGAAHFGAGARRGGHRDDGRHARRRSRACTSPRDPRNPRSAALWPAIKRDRLADVERAAAAEGDDAVVRAGAIRRDPCVTFASTGFACTSREHRARKTRRGKRAALRPRSSAALRAPGSVTISGRWMPSVRQASGSSRMRPAPKRIARRVVPVAAQFHAPMRSCSGSRPQVK